jgi:hypothetical protein
VNEPAHGGFERWRARRSHSRSFPMSAILSIQGLTKAYRSGAKVLDDVNL